MQKLWLHNKAHLGINLDPWQADVMEYKGNCILRTGRQVGKSTVVALKAVDFAIMNKGTTTLVIAASQRQASLLFEKIRMEFDDIEGKKLKKIRLKNM